MCVTYPHRPLRHQPPDSHVIPRRNHRCHVFPTPNRIRPATTSAATAAAATSTTVATVHTFNSCFPDFLVIFTTTSNSFVLRSPPTVATTASCSPIRSPHSTPQVKLQPHSAFPILHTPTLICPSSFHYSHTFVVVCRIIGSHYSPMDSARRKLTFNCYFFSFLTKSLCVSHGNHVLFFLLSSISYTNQHSYYHVWNKCIVMFDNCFL